MVWKKLEDEVRKTERNSLYLLALGGLTAISAYYSIEYSYLTTEYKIHFETAGTILATIAPWQIGFGLYNTYKASRKNKK